MHYRSRKNLIAQILVVIIGITFVLPFIWMISSSLKPDTEIFVFPPQWIPSEFYWQNYRDAITYIPFFRYLRNTLIICTGTIIGNVLSASLVAYSFMILRWKGQRFGFVLMLMTMFLPPQVTMIPVFIIFRTMGVINTYVPLILPAFLGIPFFIFLLCQFFRGIPGEMIEAAHIDGCGDFQTYWRIILPLSVPALVTVVLFSFLWAWVDFLMPLIYLQDEMKYTLSLGLQQFQSSHTVEWGMLMAASTLVTIPILILFFFAQRTFIQGIVTTGLKD